MATQTVAEEEIAPENIPLPTDSMVTVRLSDALFEAEPIDQDEVEQTYEEEQPQVEQHRSPSTASFQSSTSSSSRISTSSSRSNSVDWEVLEKTEEQEPKDECTDEVCTETRIEYRGILTVNSLPHCFSLVLNRKTTPLPKILKRELLLPATGVTRDHRLFTTSKNLSMVLNASPYATPSSLLLL